MMAMVEGNEFYKMISLFLSRFLFQSLTRSLGLARPAW